MKTVCQEKAWEDNGEIKCEYQGVLLSYKKEDVLRIEKLRTAKQSAPSSGSVEPETEASQKKVVSKAEVDARSSGLSFYDPRRTHKYWTSETSKHDTLQEAIGNLARQYNRSPEWIQANMGETNDLVEIHRNLANSNQQVEHVIGKPESKNGEGVVFYNPRRTYKYWTSKTAKHKTLQEALEALAHEYDRPPEWIQKYIGETNDLDEIRQNLKNRKLIESSQ